MRASGQLQRVQRLPEIGCIGALIDRVVGIRLGVDGDENDMRDVVIAQRIDQFEEATLLDSEISGNA